MAGRYGPVDRKKNTRPMALCVGAVPVRAARCDFNHSLSEYNGRPLRATNNEPLLFPRTQMRLCRDRLKLTTTLREALSA